MKVFALEVYQSEMTPQDFDTDIIYEEDFIEENSTEWEIFELDDNFHVDYNREDDDTLIYAGTDINTMEYCCEYNYVIYCYNDTFDSIRKEIAHAAGCHVENVVLYRYEDTTDLLKWNKIQNDKDLQDVYNHKRLFRV